MRHTFMAFISKNIGEIIKKYEERGSGSREGEGVVWIFRHCDRYTVYLLIVSEAAMEFPANCPYDR